MEWALAGLSWWILLKQCKYYTEVEITGGFQFLPYVFGGIRKWDLICWKFLAWNRNYVNFLCTPPSSPNTWKLNVYHYVLLCYIVLFLQQSLLYVQYFLLQKKVFADLGEGVLANAWKGYNCSLFAYGQTESGKSYSMVGYGANKGNSLQFEFLSVWQYNVNCTKRWGLPIIKLK